MSKDNMDEFIESFHKTEELYNALQEELTCLYNGSIILAEYMDMRWNITSHVWKDENKMFVAIIFPDGVPTMEIKQLLNTKYGLVVTPDTQDTLDNFAYKIFQM